MSIPADTPAAAQLARALVAESSDLVSLPEVATAIIRLAEDPRSTARDFETVIAGDPNLAARLLRIANSSYYSMRGRIDTIQRAVAVIGTLDVCNLAIGLSTVRAFDGIPVEVVSMDDFWTHSVYCSVLSRRLARDAAPGREGTLFLAGLLHDVGQLLIFLRRPEESRKALWMSMEGADDLTLEVAERSVLGFDHGDVGDQLGRKWHLPDLLRECMALHHSPALASAHNAVAVAVVHVANSLAYLVETESADLEAAPPIDPAAADLAHFDAALIPELVAESRAQVAEARSLFGI